MRFRGSGWPSSWAVIAQHPWLVRIVLGAMVALVLLMLLHRRARERGAMVAFETDCARRGIAEDECEDLLDRHHARCFGMSWTGSTRSGEAELVDLARYVECVRISPQAWSAKRRASLRAEEKARREELGAAQ